MPREYHLKPKPPPDDHPEFWEGEKPPDGWELLLSREELERQPAYTGERIAKIEGRRAAIVEALGRGLPVDWIVKALRVHPYTVAAIAKRDTTAIEEKKKRVGGLCWQAAGMSAESYIEDLAAGRVDPKTKVIAAGVFTDKGLVLAGQPSAIVAHVGPALKTAAVDGFWERRLAIKGAGPVVELEGAAAPELEPAGPSTDRASAALSPESPPIEPDQTLVTPLVTPPEPPPPTQEPSPEPGPGLEEPPAGPAREPGGGSARAGRAAAPTDSVT